MQPPHIPHTKRKKNDIHTIMKHKHRYKIRQTHVQHIHIQHEHTSAHTQTQNSSKLYHKAR